MEPAAVNDMWKGLLESGKLLSLTIQTQAVLKK
jgi:hypothetical protein